MNPIFMCSAILTCDDVTYELMGYLVIVLIGLGLISFFGITIYSFIKKLIK